MYSITYESSFEAAHFLPGHSKCGEIHGHSYKVLVTLDSEHLNAQGMVMDFNELKNLLDPILPDHKLLNEIYDFHPTAENLAAYFYTALKRHIPDLLAEVEVRETERGSASYYE